MKLCQQNTLQYQIKQKVLGGRSPHPRRARTWAPLISHYERLVRAPPIKCKHFIVEKKYYFLNVFFSKNDIFNKNKGFFLPMFFLLNLRI